jgi:hypothetical protein
LDRVPFAVDAGNAWSSIKSWLQGIKLPQRYGNLRKSPNRTECSQNRAFEEACLSKVRDVPESAITRCADRAWHQDVDELLRQPSFSDLDDSFSISNLRTAVDRALLAIKEHKRIVVFGDYDCDGIASHILRSGLRRFGAEVRVCLPHRDPAT